MLPYQSSNSPIFPHPLSSDENGLLALGGSLSVDWLLTAYHWGIFPWYDSEPKMWWWLSPRLVLFPEQLHVSHSVRNKLNKQTFRVTANTAFQEVMNECASVNRKGQFGATWILPELIDNYTRLHELGYAHSVEVWHVETNTLAGGLYGVAIGKIFYGESMFTHTSDASKVGFVTLVRYLTSIGITCIDCQQDTNHMRSFGADLNSAENWLDLLRQNIRLYMYQKVVLPENLS